MSYNKNKHYVIEIIDEYSIMIDYGSNDGAVKGDTVRIYEEGEEVLSIDGNYIGFFNIIKDELKVYTVFPGFSVCKKVSTKTYNSIENPLIRFNNENTTFSKININPEEMTNRELTLTTPITKGDKVDIIK